MTLIITRKWPAIAERTVTKEVTSCHYCPYFSKSPDDGNITLPLCNHPKFNGGSERPYGNVLDISPWHPIGTPDVISKLCPEIPK